MKAGWREVPLGQVVEISSGGTPSKERDDYWRGDIPWVSPKDMKSDIIIDSEDHISEAAVSGSATRLIKAGALLLVVRSGILARTIPVARAGRDLTINQDIKALTPSNRLDGQFLAHFLKSREPYLLDKVTRGATVHKLDTPAIKSLPIPLPPLDEQKRIVAVLDEAFEGLSRARANAEANLADARELFRRCLEVDFVQLAETQPRRTIGEVASIKGGKRLPKGEKLVPTKTPFPYISIKDFNDQGSVDVDSVDYLLPKTREAIKNYIIRSDDLYISIAGTIGKTGIVPAELDGANLTENAARMIFKDGVNNEYVYYFTLTNDFQNQAGLNTRTAAQPKLALERLKTISLPVAPPTVQIEMADRFRSIREQSQAGQSHYRTKIQAIDTLRQSLLQKAFSGELT